MTKSEKGMFLFYDWLDRLKELPAKDAMDIIMALSLYCKEGIDPTTQFEGALKCIVALMHDQIIRAERKSEVGRESVKKRWEQEPNVNLIGANSNVEQPNTTSTVTDTVTNTVTNTDNTTITTTRLYRLMVSINREEKKEYRKFKAEIFSYFNENDYISSPDAFIKYNEKRKWIGVSGEEIDEVKVFTYIDEWEKNERLHRGLSLEGISIYERW